MRLSIRLAAVLALASSAVSSRAIHADTYRVYELSNLRGAGIVGFDDAGNVIVQSNDGCGIYGAFGCYLNYFNGVYQSMSNAPQGIGLDGGTPCTLSFPGAEVDYALCNNGQYAFIGLLDQTQNHKPMVYEGPTPLQQVIGGAGNPADPFYFNALHDIIWTDASTDAVYEAVDLNTAPVPEPSSLTLLGTGLLGLAGMAPRYRHKRSAG